MKSLCYHSTLRDGLSDGDLVHQDRVAIVEITADLFEDASWQQPCDFLTYTHYVRTVASLDFKSSPGYPYLQDYQTNALFFDYRDGEVSLTRLNAIWEQVSNRINNRDSDPIRLFIKPEPHKVKKLENFRYRLISSVSVIDQIIDKMLFDPFIEACVKNYHYLPSKVGWSPYKGGWKTVPIAGQMSCDKSGWDWSVKPWYFELGFDVICRLGDFEQLWVDLARWRFKELFGNARFVTSDGVFLKQKQAGVMKSGSVLTIILNSLLQTILHVRVTRELGIPTTTLWAMGDDTTQNRVRDVRAYLAVMKKYCIVKEAVPRTEFAGHLFIGARVEPLYWGKHCYQLLHADDSVLEDLGVSYALLYHRSCKRDIVRGILEHLGVKSAPLDVLTCIFDAE